MAFEGVCLNCFSQRGDFEVCPYCGYVAGTLPAEGYLLAPGTRLWGRYVVGTVLGAGGFGITYKAWDTRLSAIVAIKEFFPQNLVSRIPGENKVRVFSGDKQAAYADQLARFMDEAKNLAKFTGDAHIVNVLDFFEDGGTAYIVMEYLDGQTLKQYMAEKGGRLPTQQAMEIAKSLLTALTSIHQKGIIHRDISPDNIYILHDGTMKVLDFGAARFAARENPEFTQNIVVKKGYAPPEQYRSNMKQGVWTDIYAAGATIYKMMTGITPEESIERTEKDVLKRPSQTGTAVDAAVDKAVMKAMALRPELRFKSADAMLAALENRTVVDFPEEELKKRRKKNSLLVALSVVLVAVLGGVIIYRATQNPTIVYSGGPSLADMNIQPDTITLMKWDNGEERNALYHQLAAAFMEKYPQHTVNVEIVSYEDGIYEQLQERLLSPDAPAVFSMSVDLDNDETPYMLELSMLYQSLDMNEYLFLGDYFEMVQKRDDPTVYSIYTGFDFEAAYVNLVGAQERGLEVPDAVTDFDYLWNLEKEIPGTVQLQAYQFGQLLGALKPNLRTQKDLDALEGYVSEFIDLYKQGHFRQHHDTMQYPYRNMMYEFSDSSTSNVRGRSQHSQGQYKLVPVVYEGELQCRLTNSYHVSSHVTENQQKLGMLFLHFLLSEYSQNVIYVQNSDVQPLQKTAMEQYIAVNPEYAFLTGEYADKMTRGRTSFYFEYLYEATDEYAGGTATKQQVLDDLRERYRSWIE